MIYRTTNKRIFYGLLFLMILIGVVLLVWKPWRHPKIGNTGVKITTDNPVLNPSVQPSERSNGSNSDQSNPKATGPTSSNQTSSGPQAPSGNFVSSYQISLSGQSMVNSICQTTAGATCDIQLTKSGVTKNLGSKPTDNDGVVSWDWSPSSVGLTQGPWQVTAVAILSGQTQTTQSTKILEVRP